MIAMSLREDKNMKAYYDFGKNEEALDNRERFLEKFQDYFKIAAEWETKAKTIIVTNDEQKTDMEIARVGRLFLREKRKKKIIIHRLKSTIFIQKKKPLNNNSSTKKK